MNRGKIVVAGLVGALALSVVAGAGGFVSGPFYVSLAGTDAGTCTAPASPCLTIGYAMSQAITANTIEVADGVYPEAVSVPSGFGVTLSGGWNPTFTAQDGGSTITGSNLRRGVNVAASGTLDISRFTIQDGVGAPGAGLYAGPGSSVRIAQSTIKQNTSSGNGGGIEVDGANVTLVNTTIATNHADQDGGGIHVTGSATLDASNVSIVSNFAGGNGGGLFDAGVSTETVKLRNSVLGGNSVTSGHSGADCSASARHVSSFGYLAVGGTSGCAIDHALGDLSDLDLFLVPLAGNGGPADTEALQQRSPLIDAGDLNNGCKDALGNPITTDERGLPRPATLDDPCDIGAYEVQPPANDDFANRQTISGAPVHVGGDEIGNVHASIESNEPEHAGDEGGGSVWYDWTAPTTQTYSVDTSGSTFDTLLAVYTGATFSDFQQSANKIGYNDDATGAVATSRVCFAATAGQHYDIAVDGYGGDSGAVDLNIAVMAPTDTAPCPRRPPTTTASTPRVGDTLHACCGTWINEDEAHATHQWYRCQAEACTAIDGAVGMDYTVTRRDLGTTLRISEFEAGGISTSDPTPPVADTPSPASANGRIFWANNSSGSFVIWSMLANGSDRRQLVTGAQPAPSPDGTKVAFSVNGHIEVMNADGSNVVDTGLTGFGTSWSPDGSRLVYTHYDSTRSRVDGIWVANADGSDDTSLLIGRYNDLNPFVNPVWSPDGSRIAFAFLDDASGHYDIGVVGADGRGGITDLTGTATADEHAPAWSPDGTQLVFVRGPLSGGIDKGDLYRIDADGSNETPLVTGTTAADLVSSGVWSPTGTQLLISRYGAGGTDDLYTISPTDGSGQTTVLAMTSRDETQAWAGSVSYPLSIGVSGSGSVSCGGTCASSYADGAQVTLTASPGGGSTFSGWSGACSGSGSCTVTMLGARSVTASFAAAPAPPPPTSGGGGGGGGGGGSGGSSGVPPDIHVVVTASAATPPPVGGDLLWFVTVSSRNVGGSSDVSLDLTLPAGWTYDHASPDRGPGCVGTPPHLTCDVAFINQSTSTHVILFGKVAQPGALALTAKATSMLEPEFDPSDNTVTLTVSPAAAPTPTPSPAPGPVPSPRPAPPRVTISGTTVHVAAPAGARIQWQVCTKSGCAAIKGATKPSLKVTRALRGKSVRALVTRNGKTVASAKVPVTGRAASR